MRILRLTITGLLALVVALGLAGYLVLRNLDRGIESDTGIRGAV